MASQKEEKPRYAFNRDFRSSFRLNHNHWLVKELCGYLLHPTIQYDSNVRIADIGTGTGIWPLELAHQLSSSARIDGFDISAGQFLPEAWRGNNVHLHAHDAFKPFPTEHLGQYDIVHIRFFLVLVNKEDAEPLLNNLLTLLKPGGYLTWFELQPYASRVLKPNPSTSAVAMEQLLKTMHQPKPTSTYDWVQQLPTLFSRLGLRVEASETIPLQDRYRLCWGQSILAALEDLTEEAANKNLPLAGRGIGEESDEDRRAGSRVVGKGVGPEDEGQGPGSSVGKKAAEEAARMFIDALSAEFGLGVSVDVPFLCVCVVGRKAV